MSPSPPFGEAVSALFRRQASLLHRRLLLRSGRSRAWCRRRRPLSTGRPCRTKSSSTTSSSDGAGSASSSSASSPPAAEDALPVPNNILATPAPPPAAALAWHARLGPVTRLAYAYARAQRTRPYATQVASSLAIYLAADLSAQGMSGREYDYTRTARSLAIGAGASIPGYKWFIFLHHNFNYASRTLSLAVKVLVNQVVFAPLFNTYFFGAQALLAGEDLAAVAERLRRTVPTSLVNSVKLWPAVTAFSFTFVPVEYRSVFAGVVAVGWQTYLSFLNRTAEDATARAAAGEDPTVTHGSA